MRRTRAQYWVCQTAGWGAYSTIGLTTGVLDNGWRPSIVIGYILFFLYSIGLTHLLRAQIHRRNWTSLPLHRALVRLAASSIAIAAVQCAFVVIVYAAIEGRLGIWSQPSAIAFMFMGVSIVTTIWTVLYLAITTFRHSREVRNNEMRMKLALSNAELRALEAQVNPHFLFNCLNSIRGMIGEDPAQAQDMVTRLANILRYNLQKDRRHTVALESEVEAVSDYLALESIRFEDRLRVHLEVEEQVRQIAVPSMLLQTLVENAIKHGVEEIPSGGDLSIRAVREGAALRIDVENTGSLGDPRPGSTQIGLTNAPEIEISGEARTGEEALDLIGRLDPDVLFLDIRMPGMNGFDLLGRLDDVPQVIFTTAYDEYALKAFEVSALDYLVKPVAPARLAAAVAKLHPRAGRSRLEQVFVKDGERCWLVRVSDIFLLESEGNYTRIHFGNERPLVPRSLAALQERLDPGVFFRAGRRHIINLKWVERVAPGIGGNLLIMLRGGTRVEMSRRQSARFREALSL